MNKFLRIFVIAGAFIILILLAFVYFGSKKIAQSIEEQLNQSLEETRIQLEQSHEDYIIQKLEYKPFQCSGVMDYTCKSDSIMIYTTNPTAQDDSFHESIHLQNIVLGVQNVKSKTHLSLDITTDIDYPSIEEFFGDSQANEIVDFLNQSADALLPSKARCKIDFFQSSNKNETQDSIHDSIRTITLCNTESQIFNSQLESNNIFVTNTNKSHILGAIYEIAMALSSENDEEQIQLQHISHALESIQLSLTSKLTFQDFLAKNTKLSPEQKQSLSDKFDVIHSRFTEFNKSFLQRYMGKNNVINNIVQGLWNISHGKIKTLDIVVKSRKESPFQSLAKFQTMSAIDLFLFVANHYDIQTFADRQPQQTTNNADSKTTKQPENITTPQQDEAPATNQPTNELLEPPAPLE